MKRYKKFAYILLFVLVMISIYKFSKFYLVKDQITNGKSEKIIISNKEDIEGIIKELSNLPIQLKKQTTNLTSNQEIKYSYLTKYPDMLSCNTHEEALKKWSPRSEILTSIDEYKSSASEIAFSKRILRGVLVYFPLEKSNEFIPEFKWLYRSWIEMIRNEPTKWRTDLIVFTNCQDDVFLEKKYFLNELNCSILNKRKNELDEPMCTLIDYKPIETRKFKTLSNFYYNQNEESKKKIFDYLLSKVDIFSSNEDNLLPFYTVLKETLNQYGYTDSILMAFDGYEYFKSARFDFLLRSDIDVFLTPLFSKWLPKNCNDFIVGGGAYSENFNRKRLKRIAIGLNLKHAGADNLGSTWYSTPDQFRIVSYLTLISMIYISKEEFAQPEKQGKVDLWPYWHYGVLLLYGQNIAMNHLIAFKHMNVVKLAEMIDFPSDNTENINNKIHIHVYHDNVMFSKFSFKNGNYDNMTVPTENLNQVKTYCLKLALESKRIESTDLRKMLLIDVRKKN